MNIIYISSTCSRKKFAELFKNSRQIPGQQVQKYHRLIMEGLIMNNAMVKTVTALPITRRNTNRILIINKVEEEDGIIYTYLPILNIPILKNIFVALSSFIITLKYLFEDKDAVIVCDVLNISVSFGALLAAKMLKRKNLGIVTDVPIFLSGNSSSFNVRINNFIIKKFDLYVFLTEQMNELINKGRKPYVVIEGQVDIKMKDIDNLSEKKYARKICIYAGGIHKKYGIKTLTEAFIKANIKDAELHIYGDGDYKEELIEICNSNKNIKYFGVVLNQDVVDAELKATLLINPRPSCEEYTKYSFPSKNMEYMVSGTPVLTTKLPGMPKEYYPYVYLIEEENIQALSQTLRNILLTNREELHEKGKQAKQFVLKEKNNMVQSTKLLKLIERNISDM